MKGDIAMFRAAEDCFMYMNLSKGHHRKQWEAYMYKFLFYFAGYEE